MAISFLSQVLIPGPSEPPDIASWVWDKAVAPSGFGLGLSGTSDTGSNLLE